MAFLGNYVLDVSNLKLINGDIEDKDYIGGVKLHCLVFTNRNKNKRVFTIKELDNEPLYIYQSKDFVNYELKGRIIGNISTSFIGIDFSKDDISVRLRQDKIFLLITENNVHYAVVLIDKNMDRLEEIYKRLKMFFAIK